MITAQCSIGKRLPKGGFSYAEMQIVRLDFLPKE